MFFVLNTRCALVATFQGVEEKNEKLEYGRSQSTGVRYDSAKWIFARNRSRNSQKPR
jgi:hypothetical protein